FSTFSPDNLNVWWMNILTLMTLLLSAPAVLLVRRHVWRDRPELRPVAVFTAFALFMALPLSRPVWSLLSPLQQTQFPWRWLALISMGIAIFAAAGLASLDQTGQGAARVKRLIIMGALSISVVFTLSHVVREAKFLPRHSFDETLSEVRGTASVNYWFPVWASSTPAAMNTAVDAADRAVTVQSWTPESRRFSIAAGNATEARVKTFYYPHWIAKSREQLLRTRADKDGALLLSLPHEAVSVDLEFVEPRRSQVSSYASLAGLIFIGGLGMPLSWRRKQ